MGLSAEARFNIDARLKTKEDQFTDAALLAHGLRVEVLSDDGVVVPGQDVRVSISIGDRGRPVTVSSVALDGFSKAATCPSGPLEVGAVYRCDAAAADSSERQSHQTLLEAVFRSRRATSSSPMRRSACRSVRRRSARRSR